MPKNLAGAASPEILQAALQGLESQRDKLDEQIAQVRALLGKPRKSVKAAHASKDVSSATAEAGGSKRNLSPDARKRIAAAQKKRWAAFRKTQK